MNARGAFPSPYNALAFQIFRKVAATPACMLPALLLQKLFFSVAGCSVRAGISVEVRACVHIVLLCLFSFFFIFLPLV
jgi:hypothetical protein